MTIPNALLASITVLNIILAVTVVFLERRSPATTWAWLMILTFLPIVGFVCYIILGQNLSRRKIFKWDKKVYSFMKIESARQKGLIHSDPSHLLNHTAEKHKGIVHLHLNNDEALYTGNNSIWIYTKGEDKFNALLSDIARARKHIHIQYYIIRSDRLGERLADLLLIKAQEGVKVRLIYDESGSRRLSRRWIRSLKQGGIEIVPFFPAKIPLINFRLNYRNHRKLAIIDGEIGYIGGFNIGDEYLGLHRRFGKWRDTHLRVAGAAVNSMQTRFLLDWNQAAGQDIEFQNYFGMNLLMLEGEGVHAQEIERAGNLIVPVASHKVGMQIVSSGPDSEWEQIKNGYLNMIAAAKKYVYIQTPYFIPDDSLLDALRTASLSGIDVRVMVPNIPDHPFVFWATQSYLGELLRAGGRAYRYKNGFLHAKTIVVDDEIASVGTANIDNRSFRLNFEVNAFMYDQQIAEKLAKQFLLDCDLSNELTYEEFLERPILVRLRESVCRLLSPIL